MQDVYEKELIENTDSKCKPREWVLSFKSWEPIVHLQSAGWGLRKGPSGIIVMPGKILVRF